MSITLDAHNAVFLLSDDVHALIAWKKPDGKQVLNNAVIQDDHVIVELTQQMLVAAGTGKAEIILYNSDSILSTSVFSFVISPSVYNQDDIESSDEYLSFLESLQFMQSVTEECTVAINQARSAAESAAAQANYAHQAAQEANSAAQAAWEAANGSTSIYDPTTGKQDTIQNVVINLFQWMLTQTGEPITAGEFDALNLTAGVFDEKQVSAIDFDTKANQLLGG